MIQAHENSNQKIILKKRKPAEGRSGASPFSAGAARQNWFVVFVQVNGKVFTTGGADGSETAGQSLPINPASVEVE